MKWGGYGMEAFSGTLFAMRMRIIDKLLKAGATSKEKAVTAREAHFDMQEQNWLCYIAGGFLASVKKTKDKRYYVVTYHRR
jgi:hypothetical protein